MVICYWRNFLSVHKRSINIESIRGMWGAVIVTMQILRRLLKLQLKMINLYVLA